LTIGDLFAETNYDHFPDKVNDATLEHLNGFLRAVGRPEAERLTVRQLVRRILSHQVPESCQCWKVLDQQYLLTNSIEHLSDEQRHTQKVLEWQRVVVTCSKGVLNTMREAVQEAQPCSRRSLAECSSVQEVVIMLIPWYSSPVQC
jgi:hypothetical protein